VPRQLECEFVSRSIARPVDWLGFDPCCLEGRDGIVVELRPLFANPFITSWLIRGEGIHSNRKAILAQRRSRLSRIDFESTFNWLVGPDCLDLARPDRQFLECSGEKFLVGDVGGLRLFGNDDERLPSDGSGIRTRHRSSGGVIRGLPGSALDRSLLFATAS